MPDRCCSRRGEKHRVRLRAREPLLGLSLVGEIERRVVSRKDLAALAREPARDGGAGHARVTGEVNALPGEIK